MNNIADTKASLADKRVWIVDDEIPIHKAAFEHEDMVEGKRPIDRGSLLSLLPCDDWTDLAVRNLCEELVREAGNVLAFPQPDAAVRYLKDSGMTPDIVVFDLRYGQFTDEMRVLACLEDILNYCIPVVQVYARDPTAVGDKLSSLQARFPTRLQPPVYKTTGAKELALMLSKKMDSSLSARIAQQIRRLSLQAVENVLVRIDDLPLQMAIRLLAGDTGILQDMDLVELLSLKVGDAIKFAPELTHAVERYAVGKGIPPDRINRFVEEAVDLLASHLRERVLYDGWLYNAIQSACAECSQETNRIENATAIVREFTAFRLYDQPKDPFVRTGDIILTSQSNESSPDANPELYLVLTPPCDLARFWKKTRGVLTLAKMHPGTPGRGVRRVRKYGNPKPSQISSVTATNPIVLPSVPICDGLRQDYVLFMYEIEHKTFDGESLWRQEDGIGQSARFGRPLTYGELGELGVSIERKCKISEPFLTGILSALGQHLFRTGVPEFPKEEEDRLKTLFAVGT